jgi:hypothetical protein
LIIGGRKMGYKMTKYEFQPGKNEQIEMMLTLEKETRSVIHGVVVDNNKFPVKDAVVKLFEMPDKENCCNLIPITHTFTDECGQFIFGPLASGRHYVIKVWYNSITIKHVSGKPFECENTCPEHNYDK